MAKEIAVILPIEEYEGLLGDLEDLAIIAERRDEPNGPIEIVKERLERRWTDDSKKFLNEYTAVIKF